MTCEVEILKYLREQELPEDEVNWREEDCAYLTVKALEELQELIKKLGADKEILQEELSVLDELKDDNNELTTELHELYIEYAKLEETNNNLNDTVIDLEKEIVFLEEQLHIMEEGGSNA